VFGLIELRHNLHRVQAPLANNLKNNEIALLKAWEKSFQKCLVFQLEKVSE
jgi:hypothetical protein